MRQASLPILVGVALALANASAAVAQSLNFGGQEAAKADLFDIEPIAQFNKPWSLIFLPDGRLLVTEEPGHLFLVERDGRKTEVGNLPRVDTSRDDGLLDIVPAPDFAVSSTLYFTYVDPSDGGHLALARASLSSSEREAELADVEVVWRQKHGGGHGTTGGVLAFDPQGSYLYLAIGDFMEPETAQDPASDRGKVIRFNVGGAVNASGRLEPELWTSGHRNPYGLAFAPGGRLWMHEMGPRGGDELNLLAQGRNYGWPLVSEGNHYGGSAIPGHETRSELAAPHAHWTPVISPAGLSFYSGQMFPRWEGAALIGGLSSRSLIAVRFDGDANPTSSERWDMGARIRDVATAPDGSVYMLEDGSSGRLLRLTPAH